jgi:hypothetical protein
MASGTEQEFSASLERLRSARRRALDPGVSQILLSPTFLPRKANAVLNGAVLALRDFGR